MEAETLVQSEVARSDIYKLLAECYYPPDEAFSGKLLNLGESLESVCPPARQKICEAGKQSSKADILADLKVEFARLFVGPYSPPAPPYGSVYLEPDRRIMGNSTLDAVKRYRQSGLDMAAGFKDAPDHIAAELEFIHFLIVKEIEAASQGDVARLVNYLLRRQSFLTEHLGAWVPEFAERVFASAEISLYQYLARATALFIENDIAMIPSVLAVWLSDADASATTGPFQVYC